MVKTICLSFLGAILSVLVVGARERWLQPRAEGEVVMEARWAPSPRCHDEDQDEDDEDDDDDDDDDEDSDDGKA